MIDRRERHLFYHCLACNDYYEGELTDMMREIMIRNKSDTWIIAKMHLECSKKSKKPTT